MIRLYDFDEVRPEEILNRDIRAEADVEATVDAIIADVRARGDAALIEYAAKFDHAELTDVRVSQAEIEEAFAELEKTDPEFITTLKMAAENIRHFHEQQLHKNFVVNDKPGIVLGQKYTPHPARGRLRAGRHGGVPVHRADGRHSRQGRGRRADRHDDPRGTGRQGEPRDSGRRRHCGH